MKDNPSFEEKIVLTWRGENKFWTTGGSCFCLKVRAAGMRKIIIVAKIRSVGAGTSSTIT